jgi:uncharacterized protein YggE
MKKLTILLFVIISLKINAQEIRCEKSKLSLTGTAKLIVKPDLAVLSISVSEIKNKMTDAIKALREKSNYYNEVLKKLGFNEKDIKTTGFTVYKNRFYRDNEYIDSGYVASQNLKLEFIYSQENMQKIVSEFAKNEKPIDFSFHFELSEQFKQKVQAQLIEKAIQDANEKASVISKASRVKLISIINISYGNVGRDIGVPFLEDRQKFAVAMNAGQEMKSFNFTPDDLILNENIHIEWIIE